MDRCDDIAIDLQKKSGVHVAPDAARQNASKIQTHHPLGQNGRHNLGDRLIKMRAAAQDRAGLGVEA
jgi:hypothetical protein